jgi:hypothetical protein
MPRPDTAPASRSQPTQGFAARHAHGDISPVITKKNASPVTATGMWPKISDWLLVVTFRQFTTPVSGHASSAGLWKCT